MPIYLYNTLSRRKEEFVPIDAEMVGLYTCGPTVYNYAHLGNLRTYVFEDVLKRVLQYNGLAVKHVMNITDVGHLTGDMDMGEDKLEVGAKREGKSAWEVAKFYEEAFKRDLIALNIQEPTIWCRATEHITEQIDLIKELVAKGFAYQTTDGLYFDTSKIADYNKLSHLNLSELKEGARVEKNEEKRQSTDFALWKFSPKNERRQMEWESPWGVGFPGWHIECSAMSMAELGDRLDIHCGGIDHINVHHTNEIAQSEAATGKKFFNYWLHGAFLNIAGGKKMAKSEVNFLTLLSATQDKGLATLAYRYACLQTHYRKPMEYSEESMINAQNGFDHLRNQVGLLSVVDKGIIDETYRDKFLQAVNDDLNMPQALAVTQELLKSDLSAADKLATIIDFDLVLGLDLSGQTPAFDLAENIVDESARDLIRQRAAARQNKNWQEADRLRDEIAKQGFVIIDRKDNDGIDRQWVVGKTL